MESVEGSRRSSRRAAKGPSNRKKVLDQIKKHRETGEKVDYDFNEEKDVYELVDENHYAQLVQERQEEDFIVDDDGGGYVDDGREIFDDDPNEIPNEKAKSKKEEGKKAEKSNVKSSNIASMFSAGTNLKKRKKETDVTLDGDDVLEDILNSLGSTESNAKAKTVTNTKTPKRSNKHPPRRLQEEKKVTVSKKSRKIIPLKVKQETVPVDDGFVENDSFEHQEPDFPDSQDSCYVSQDSNRIVKTEEFKSSMKIDIDDIENEDENVDMKDVKELAEEASDLKSEKKEEKTIHKQDWQSMFDKKFQEAPIPDVCMTPSSVPTKNVNGEEVLRFFWLDAYEDAYNQPGTVYMFGKVWIESSKTYVSCCVAIKNIERQLYFLPRSTRHSKNGKDLEQIVEFKDVYEEFDQKISNTYKIMEYKCRKVRKGYAFAKTDVAREETEYLEILYSATQPKLPSDLRGETFSHVFGTNTSSLELLFLNQHLQGPAWLDIKYPQVPKQSISWCKIEVCIDRPSFVSVVKESIPSPPLTVLSLSMVATTNSKTHSHEIISFCGHVHPQVYLDKAAPNDCYRQSFCFVTKPSDQVLPFDFQTTVKKMGFNIQISPSERSMLGLLLAKIQTIDADIIVGHDIRGFDFDVLLHCLQANKVAHWSKIGRLKRNTYPKLSSGKQGFMSNDTNTACGRLVCDVKISAKELIRCKSYDLTELVSVVLNKPREDLLPENIEANMRNTNSLLQMLKNNMIDAEYKLRLMYELNILPLAFQITSICGNVMSRTLLGGRSERNEFLLLHAFSKRNYILPDKEYSTKRRAQNTDQEGTDEKKKGKSRRKPAYTGGLVLEPKKGFYDKYILLLDFNSLYPSIIQEYNICFTTIPPSMKKDEDEEEELPEVPSSDLEAGVLPTEIKRLVERRKQVKNLLKKTPTNSELYIQYDIRQKALKLTANSMYGCLGFSHSRFYAKPLAALVTGKGREILMKTKDLATALGLDVIYGDTDSIMINTNSVDLQEVRKIGSKVKSEVNKLYRLVEIDIDGIFKSMLLLKKKKYAAVMVNIRDDGTITTTTEMKGLDIVRRDWSDLAKDAGNYVLDQILSASQRDVIIENIHDYLTSLTEKIKAGKIELQKFEINKSLTKNPDDYPDKKSLPHVTVAQRLLAQGRRVAVGDTISYVICDDNSQLPASQRAYHPDECLKKSSLKIDNHYYLSSQIHPVVSRLCDPIEGADSAFIASCLGLDPSAYKSKTQHQQSEETPLTILMSDEDRFKDVDKFFVRCNNAECTLYKKEVEFKGSFDKTAVDPFKCSSCQSDFNKNRMKNSLRLFVRERISKYYSCWMSCDDQTCGYVSRHTSVKDLKKAQICQQCNKGLIHVEYNDAALYNQLFYLCCLFDPSRNADGDKMKTRDNLVKWHELHTMASRILSSNAYSVVNISNLF